MKIFNLISCVLFTLKLLPAQIGGNSTYQFLNLISSPRQAALGGKVITIMMFLRHYIIQQQ